MPLALQPTALAALGWTPEQFAQYRTGAEAALITAGLLIVAFAVMRGFFAFGQGYLSGARFAERGLRFPQRALR